MSLHRPSPNVAAPCAPRLGVTQEPPPWFHGDPRRWQAARQQFEQATRRDIDAAQHVLVGGGLLTLGGFVVQHLVPLPVALQDGTLFPWALMLSASIAMILGHRRRDRAHLQMMLAVEHTLLRSAHPQVTAAVDLDSDGAMDLAIEAHNARLKSPRGSFDELVNAVVEARMIGGVVVAPLRWRGGMVFRTMAPLVGANRDHGPSGPTVDRKDAR